MPVFNYVPGRNDAAARDHAFYLLKKYTSATLLRRAIDLYEEFLNDFEREIKKPENVVINMYGDPIPYEDDLLYFLEYLPPLEAARPLLTVPSRRREAFELLRKGIKFSSFIWGRRYEGSADPTDLFYKLGYRQLKQDAVGIFGKASLSGALISLLMGTLNKAGRIYLSKPVSKARSVMCWTYESIFFDDLPFNRIPKITFPEQLPSCPPPNEESEGQIWSGQKIPVTGVWEPWAINHDIGVRCPNYYLAGDTASEYQFEGTDTLEKVRWRLIWKDTRYGSGNTPIEEDSYFPPEQMAIRGRSRTAWAGTICPESGDWYTPQLKQRTYIQAGETMPGPENIVSGAVVWYLRIVEPEPLPELEPEADDVIARLGYNPVVEPKPTYCKSEEMCPKAGLWVPIVPKDIQGYGNLALEPVRVEVGNLLPRFGTHSDEDEARIVWKWVGENGEYWEGRRRC